MADQFTPVQAQKFTLAGSGVSTTATSIILSSFKLPDGSTTITMSNFGDIGYGTLEPGTSREEQISFTGVTQNGDGTATLSGVTRGLRFVAPYDEVTANKKLHAGGAVFVLSNTAAFYAELGGKDNDETVTGLWTYTQFPKKSGTTTPTDADQFAPKAYVDATATGSAVYDQNVVAGVAGETLAAGNLVYFKTSDGRWWLTDADTAATVDGVILGFAQGAATAGVAVNVVIGGVDKNQSGLTAGTTYYASNTAGALSSSAGTVERIVGKALTTTSIILNPNFAVIPTADEKEALVGSSGTPSSANKFITADDVSSAAASGKIVRASGTALPALDGSALTGINASRKLTSITADTTVSSTTSDTALITYSVTGGTLSTANVIRLTTRIRMRTESTNAVTFRLKYGATTVCSAAVSPAVGTGIETYGYFVAYLFAAGTTSSQEGSFQFTGTKSEPGNYSDSEAGRKDFVALGTASEDSTADKNLVLSYQPGANSANDYCTVYHSLIEIIK